MSLLVSRVRGLKEQAHKCRHDGLDGGGEERRCSLEATSRSGTGGPSGLLVRAQHRQG